MNKHSIAAGLIVAGIAAPGMSFAQSAPTVTHASLRAEILQLEKAGYNPAQVSPSYPAPLQAAENQVATTPSSSTRPVIVAMNKSHRRNAEGMQNDDRP